MNTTGTVTKVDYSYTGRRLLSLDGFKAWIRPTAPCEYEVEVVSPEGETVDYVDSVVGGKRSVTAFAADRLRDAVKGAPVGNPFPVYAD